MRFYTGSQFPADYRNNIFVAEHGSWNRSKKSGYQVARVVLDAQGRVLRQEPFVQGWLQVDAAGRESVLGRPADVLVLPDGSLLISDDLGGAIYPCATGPERLSGPSDELASVLQPKPPKAGGATRLTGGDPYGPRPEGSTLRHSRCLPSRSRVWPLHGVRAATRAFRFGLNSGRTKA